MEAVFKTTIITFVELDNVQIWSIQTEGGKTYKRNIDKNAKFRQCSKFCGFFILLRIEGKPAWPVSRTVRLGTAGACQGINLETTFNLKQSRKYTIKMESSIPESETTRMPVAIGKCAQLTLSWTALELSCTASRFGSTAYDITTTVPKHKVSILNKKPSYSK